MTVEDDKRELEKRIEELKQQVEEQQEIAAQIKRKREANFFINAPILTESREWDTINIHEYFNSLRYGEQKQFKD